MDAIKSLISEIKQGNNLPIANWLKLYRVIPNNSDLCLYKEDTKWNRLGSETYLKKAVIHFLVRDELISKEIVFKALINMNSVKSLEDWARRRMLLYNNQIPVSNWYYHGNGIILEDYYSYSFEKVNNINELERIAYILDNLGFYCLNFLNDIRCNEDGHPFYIDFGFDLGEPSPVRKNNCIFTLKNYINSIEHNGKNTIID